MIDFITGLIIGATLGIILSCNINRNVDEYWRKETARRGHSHFYIDENQNRQWNWKEPKP